MIKSLFLLLPLLIFSNSAPAAETLDSIKKKVQASALLNALGITNIQKVTNGYSAQIGSETVSLFAGPSNGIALAVGRSSYTLLKDFALSNAVVVISEKAGSVSLGDLPSNVSASMKSLGISEVELVAGANVYSSVSTAKSNSQVLKSAVSILGVSSTAVLQMQADQNFAKKLFGKESDGGEFKIKLSFESWAPKAMSTAVSGKNLTLELAHSDSNSVTGKFDLTLKMSKLFSGAKDLDIPGSITVENFSSSNPTYTFSTQDGKGIKWSKAFGLNFLNFSDLGINMKVESKDVDIKLAGKVDGKLVNIELKESGGKITDYEVQYPGPVKLSSLDGVKEIPGASEFSFSDLTVSHDAFRGKTSFKKETIDAVVFKTLSGSWNLSLRLEKDITLGEIVNHNKGLLKLIAIPAMHVLVSKSGIHGDFSEFPLAAQEYFGKSSGEISVASGFSIHGDFDPQHFGPGLKKALGKIGITKKIPLTGTIGGVFGGPKSFDLQTELSESPGHSFKFLKSVKVKEVFFFRFAGDEVDLGF
ncbi:MAG: hypothetical protein AAF202_04660, partial [Pseudomonadota bacterium]